MPVYNAEATLRKAIDSVLSQHYKDIHLVIVDDCSTDQSYEIAMSYASNRKVSVYRNKKNMGAYYSRNYGLYVNKDNLWGYFTTHDADDISYPRRFSVLLNYLKNRKHVAVQDVFERKKLDTKESLGAKITMAHAMFKREVFKDIGYFDHVRFAGDWEYWDRLNTLNKKRDKTTVSANTQLGESFMHDKNLTVQVPIKSKERARYVLKSRKMHSRMSSTGKFYIDFTPETFGDVRPRMAGNNEKTLKIKIVLLTWQRLANLKVILNKLTNQTVDNFEIHISNANLKHTTTVDRYAKHFAELRNKNITVSHDGNEIYAFRRFTVGQRLAKEGTEIIMFIDDDVEIPNDYVENALKQYEPKTYASGFTWNFQDNGADYYQKRTRRWDNKERIHYCGTGISMIDASIFLDNALLDAPKEAYKIEDLWLSYYAQHVKGWQLKYIDLPNVKLGGADRVALYKQILTEDFNKADFLRMLVGQYGWKL